MFPNDMLLAYISAADKLELARTILYAPWRDLLHGPIADSVPAESILVWAHAKWVAFCR